jgi:hypothetical protein
MMRLQPFSSLLTLLILSQLQPGSFLRLAASESDDLRLQHQPEYFNSLLANRGWVFGGLELAWGFVWLPDPASDRWI